MASIIFRPDETPGQGIELIIEEQATKIIHHGIIDVYPECIAAVNLIVETKTADGEIQVKIHPLDAKEYIKAYHFINRNIKEDQTKEDQKDTHG